MTAVGTPAAQQASPPVAAPARGARSAETSAAKAKTRTTPWLLIVLLGIVAFFAYRHLRRPEPPPLPSGPAPVVVDGDGRRTAVPPAPPAKRGPIIDEQVSIKEDFYYASIVELNRDATVTFDVDVLAGPAIETLALDAEGFQQFEKAGKSFLGGKYSHFPAFKMNDVRKDRRAARLAKGRYYFVLDNTDQGATAPPSNLQEDTATVRVVIHAQ